MCVFSGSALRSSVLYWPQAGCPEVSAYSSLCSELTRCFDTGAKLKMYLFREATNEVVDKGRNAEKYFLNRASNKPSMWLKHCCPHHSQSNLAFALAVWVCLSKTFVSTLCFLIIHFIGMQKKEPVWFTSYCRFYSNGKGVLTPSPVQLKHPHWCWWHVRSSPWAHCPGVRFWILNLHCCSTHSSLCALLQLPGTVCLPSFPSLLARLWLWPQ